MTIWTIGHSTRRIEDFVALLRENGVSLLVDVRRFPGSRQNPQFNRESLERSLGTAGMAYRHAPDLGGRRSGQPDSPNTAWRNSGFRGYADWMGTEAFRQAFESLVRTAATRETAVMCAESVPWRCHRNLLADALTLNGVGVIHILAPGETQDHEVHEAARADARGRVTYPSTRPQIDLI